MIDDLLPAVFLKSNRHEIPDTGQTVPAAKSGGPHAPAGGGQEEKSFFT
jgi:hypothetical protein